MHFLEKIRDILDPPRYHGRQAGPPFFEGWYYKLVDRAGKCVMAVIPGVHLNQDRDKSHAFIQWLHGETGLSQYVRYPMEQFQAADKGLHVRIGDNHFSRDDIRLDVRDKTCRLQGELTFTGVTPWPVTLRSPGIMGWYAYVPFMECYHGIISLDHEINGTLKINDEGIDFSGGRGYCEKDWGRSFPKAYLWVQSNHFDDVGTSLIASVAVIPWLRNSSFLGFIIGLRHQGVLYRFATYTGARLESMAIDDGHLMFAVADRRLYLEIKAERGAGGLLRAPNETGTAMRIAESLQGRVKVRLLRFGGKRPGEIFCGLGEHAGVDAAGDLQQLFLT